MKKLLPVFLIFLLHTIDSTGQLLARGFNSIHTPDGINIIAVGDSGLIFRSSDRGNTWSGFIHGSDNFRSVYSFNNDVWFTGNNGNVYKTQRTVSPIYQYYTGTSFLINSIHFVNSNTGFVCGNGGEVFKTTDGGINWSNSNSGISNIDLNSISFVDESRGVVVGKSGSIFLTTDGGNSWVQNASSTNRNLLDVKYYSDGIYATGEHGTLLSNDSGKWNAVNTQTDSDIRGVTGISYGNTHICGGGGFIRNNLSGRINFKNFETNPMFANLVDIFYYNDYLGFAVSNLNKAIIITSNGGATWDLPPGTQVNLNWVVKLPNVLCRSNTICKHPLDNNSAFAVDRKKVFLSRNKGENWTQIATISIGTRARSFYVSPLDTNILIAAMEITDSTDCIVRSTNYGSTWTKIIAKEFSSYGQPLEMDQNNPIEFYFAPVNVSSEGMYKSTNSGATFSLISVYNSDTINAPNDLIVTWDSSEVLIMGDEGGDIWKSTNSAITWKIVKQETYPFYLVPSICNTLFDKSFFLAPLSWIYNVYKSTNYGDNWSIISINTEEGWGSDICHEDPTVVLTGSFGTQVFFSTNGGENFFETNAGFSPEVNAGIMAAGRDFILNITNRNLRKLSAEYTVLTSVFENTVSSLPTEFKLSQNYPNPFNPSTKINFSIPNSGFVSLKVYDMLGREAADLVGGFRNGGTYEIDFDASQLAAGSYFYKLVVSSSNTLVANDFSISKKMILLK
ncbi:MAG: T9SS type A sorting domain-containing protein [Ignavibacteria bacterium]|nr:T9SS type A sorting domain-containing protein [Ignavibacteria bacterium]